MQAYKPILFVFLLFCLCRPADPVLAAVQAAVDRTSMAMDETVNLTISSDSGSFFSRPDLSPLEKDFSIQGQNQSSSTQFVNGKMTSSTQWNVVLSPKRVGTLQIPAISVGKEKTRPLAVEVKREAQPKTRATEVPIFLQTETDQPEVFVQAQLLYTLRIFIAVNAKVQDPGLPQVQDALIEKLGEASSYDKIIDGKSYRVFELKFAIFPQKSGLLEIPPMAVTATVPSGQPYNSFFDFDPFASRGKEIRLRSENEKVVVKEKVDGYPKSATWLPSSGLSMQESWSQPADALRVGESTTVTIAMSGEGLLGAQLPPVELPEVEGVKLYQGKAEVRNEANRDGITGLRLESIAVIPTNPGRLTLPEIRLPWFNKQTGIIEYAVIPAKELTIAGTAATTNPPPEPQKTAVRPTEPQPALSSQKQPAAVTPGIWPVVAALLAVCWMLTLLLLIRVRIKSGSTLAQEKQKEKNEKELREKEAFAALRQACEKNNAKAARQGLIAWAGAFWPAEKFYTLGQIGNLLGEQQATEQLRRLEASLYGDEAKSAAWRGELLLDTVKSIRHRKKGGKDKKNSLPPLYK